MASALQNSPNPTRKLTAAMIGSAITEVARVVLQNFAPGWADPAMWVALSPLIILASGYFVKDAPNTEQ